MRLIATKFMFFSSMEFIALPLMILFSSPTHWVAGYPIIRDTKFSKFTAIKYTVPQHTKPIYLVLRPDIDYIPSSYQRISKNQPQGQKPEGRREAGANDSKLIMSPSLQNLHRTLDLPHPLANPLLHLLLNSVRYLRRVDRQLNKGFLSF